MKDGPRLEPLPEDGRNWGSLRRDIEKGIRISEENPGEWVYLRSYQTPKSATVSSAKIKKRWTSIETACRGKGIWMRVKPEGS